MIKIKPFLIVTLLFTGFTFPTVAQIGGARNNLSAGINGDVNLNSVPFTSNIRRNSLIGVTGGLTVRYVSEKYFAMIYDTQVELSVSQRGRDQLFEIISLNASRYEVTSKDPTKTYARRMVYIDIPPLAHLAFGRDRGLQFSVHAGPQISFLISESETIKGIGMNSLSDTQKALYGVKIQNKFGYGVVGGGGVESRTKKAGSFIAEDRYYSTLSDFYDTTKEDYFARTVYGTITIKLICLFDLKK